MLFTFIFTVYFIIPKMKGFYDSFKIDLPLITQFVLKVANFFSSPYFIITSLLLTVLGIHYYAKFKDRIKVLWDIVSLKLPIIGTLLIQIEMNSFTKILELLLKSGLTFTSGLEILKGTTHNQIISNDIAICRQLVESGVSIRESLSRLKRFPPLLVNMIAIGEETGAIESVLGKIANYYKLQIDYKISNLTKLLEPILLLMIFGTVLILALAIFLPMWKMSMAVKH
jgi:type II secretory pathway component PulF